MLSKDKTQVWSNVPKPIKQRLEALKRVDHVIYSESRVIWQCLEAHLPLIEAKAQPFQKPEQEAPGRRKRRAA